MRRRVSPPRVGGGVHGAERSATRTQNKKHIDSRQSITPHTPFDFRCYLYFFSRVPFLSSSPFPLRTQASSTISRAFLLFIQVYPQFYPTVFCKATPGVVSRMNVLNTDEKCAAHKDKAKKEEKGPSAAARRDTTFFSGSRPQPRRLGPTPCRRPRRVPPTPSPSP